MGCNTSKETLQPTEEEKDKNENDPNTKKIEENNINEAKGKVSLMIIIIHKKGLF